MGRAEMGSVNRLRSEPAVVAVAFGLGCRRPVALRGPDSCISLIARASTPVQPGPSRSVDRPTKGEVTGAAFLAPPPPSSYIH